MPKNVTIDIIKNERMMAMKDDKKKKKKDDGLS